MKLLGESSPACGSVLGASWGIPRCVRLLLTEAAFRPLVAVEVDARSHRSAEVAASDHLKNRMLHLAGVTLLRLLVGTGWNEVLKDWRESRRT